jgi:hypothetical protein
MTGRKLFEGLKFFPIGYDQVGQTFQGYEFYFSESLNWAG